MRHLERPALGTSYPLVVDRVASLLASTPLRGASALVVDATGVGRPVVDLFERAGLCPIGVTITGGTTGSESGRDHRVPKRDLCAILQLLLQGRCLKIAAALAERGALVAELIAFRVHIDAVGRDSYGAAGATHDDLVLALALACWGAMRAAPPLGIVQGESAVFVPDPDDAAYGEWIFPSGEPQGRGHGTTTIGGGVGAITPPADRTRLPPYIVR